MAFVPDKPKLSFVPDKPDAAPEEPSNILERGLLGPLEAGGAALANIPGRAINAVSDLVHRLGGNDSSTPPVPMIGTPKVGQEYLRDVGSVPGVKAVGDLARRGDEAINSTSDVARDLNQGAGKVVGDAMDLAPVAGAVKGVTGALADSAAARAAPIRDGDWNSALSAVGYKNLPSKVPDSSAMANLGANTIGESTLAPSQTLNNQAVTTRLAKHEAGVAPERELSAESLKAARDNGPGKVYNAAHDALPPTLTQDPQLQGALGAIGDTTSQLPKSPDVDALKSAMLSQPQMTTDELFANVQQARERASRFYGSDQPDAHAMGDAYQGVANAYEDFIGRQLAADPRSKVSLQDWQNARTQFAKNYAVEAATKGTTDVDAKVIGRMQQKDPGNLTGGLRLIAEQGNRYPLSSGFGPTTLADNGIGSSGSVAGSIARHATGPALGAGVGTLFGGPAGGLMGGAAGYMGSSALNALIRRSLAGNPALGEAAAGRALNDPRLDSLFNPPEAAAAPPGPLKLQPPPGRAFEAHQPELATGSPQRDFFGTGANAVPSKLETGAGGPAPAGQGGDISLADLLSHGVERGPSEGLSLAPMGHTPSEGIPFKVDADHASGGLSLMDLLEGAGKENNSDLGHVMSQGVPEGTMTRTAPAQNPSPAEGGGFVFKSPNGQTIARKRGDQLQVSASLTKPTARGAGEGTQRLMDAHAFAQANGLNLVSDTKVSESAARLYDRLEQQGYEITRNPSEPDGKGNLLSTSGRPIFEVHGPSANLADLLSGTGG